jgi:hypothetical protein
MATAEAVIAHRVAKALEDMPLETNGDQPFCQDVDVDGHTIYVFVEDHQYAIEISSAM